MEQLTKKYNFKKFWEYLNRQCRYNSKWDESRTDQDVFIRRTLQKWFTNKYFRIEVENWGDYSQKEIHLHTEYIFIEYIRFGFARATQIVFYYKHPHSTKTKEIRIGYNDFIGLRIVEAEADFRILQKFYPIRTESKPNPIEQITNMKAKTKKCQS